MNSVRCVYVNSIVFHIFEQRERASKRTRRKKKKRIEWKSKHVLTWLTRDARRERSCVRSVAALRRRVGKQKNWEMYERARARAHWTPSEHDTHLKRSATRDYLHFAPLKIFHVQICLRSFAFDVVVLARRAESVCVFSSIQSQPNMNEVYLRLSHESNALTDLRYQRKCLNFDFNVNPLNARGLDAFSVGRMAHIQCSMVQSHLSRK